MKDRLNSRERQEISRERLELEDGRFCDLVGYNVKDYGFAEYAENMEISNGDFRRARSLMPFNYLYAKPSSFNWSVYNVDVSEAKRYSNAFILNFDMFRKEGKGLYIHSKTKGSGKTMLACCLANGIIEQRDICVKFISVPELLEMTKKKYKGLADLEEIDSIRKSELLIVDDIGTEMKKEWVNTELFRLIDWRYSNKRVTIFTSNVEIEGLKLDDRIVDRIYAMCIPVKLPEISIRKRNVDNKKNNFLAKIENAQDSAATPSQGNET